MAQAKQAAAAAFKKLVRLVARTVYYDQIPEGEQEEEVGAFGMRRTPQKWDSTGACVVVIDALTRREWVKEDDLAADLRMHARHLRKVLRFLEDQGVVAREHRKEAQRDRQAVPDDGEAKRKPNTYSYVSIDYPLFVDCLRLRVQRCLRLWKDELDQKNEVQQYICRSCGGRYTAFDALSMLDPRTGGFRCLVCRGEVDQLLGTGEAGDEVKRKLRRERLSGNVKRLERQLAPVHVLLNQLKDVPPPDYGSLTGWALAKQAAERERRQAGGGRGRGGGARDGSHGSWAGPGISIDNVEGDPSIEVDLGLAAAGSVPNAVAAAAAAGSSGAGGDAVETKPALPWLAQQAKPAKQEAAGSSGAAAGAAAAAAAAAPAAGMLVDSKADAKAAAGASDSNSQFLQAFLQAYSKQKLAESTLVGKPAPAAASGEDAKDAEEPTAKRQRTEAAAPESVPVAAAEPDAAAAAFEWDDEDGDGDAGGDGDGTGLTPGSQVFSLNGTADGADEFEWED